MLVVYKIHSASMCGANRAEKFGRALGFCKGPAAGRKKGRDLCSTWINLRYLCGDLKLWIHRFLHSNALKLPQF